MSYGDLNYSASDFVLFDEEMVKCLTKIDAVMETGNYAIASKGKNEVVGLEEVRKFKNILKREWNDVKVFPQRSVKGQGRPLKYRLSSTTLNDKEKEGKKVVGAPLPVEIEERKSEATE